MRTKFRVLQTPLLASDQGLHSLLTRLPHPAMSTHTEASEEREATQPIPQGQTRVSLEVSSPLVIGRAGRRKTIAIEHLPCPICGTQEGAEGQRRETKVGQGRGGEGQTGTAGWTCNCFCLTVPSPWEPELNIFIFFLNVLLGTHTHHTEQGKARS